MKRVTCQPRPHRRYPGSCLLNFTLAWAVRPILLGLCFLLCKPCAVTAQQAPRPWFRDATKEYGPIGGGPAAFADLDGDGFPELICDGRIYKNDGGKRFVDVTKDSSISGSGPACVADIDNDGRLDIYFCGG